MNRCEWANSSELMRKYHDEEWGTPTRDDQVLFEFLVLEGAQAGLSWSTVLKKREAYRKAMDGFDPRKIASYGEQKISELLQNPRLIRNRRKMESAVQNARAFMQVQKEFGSFSKYIWGFVDGKPIVNKWTMMKDLPAETELSRKISKELRKRGFNFVGPIIIYAYMQAIGMVDDHMTDCFKYNSAEKTVK